MSVLVYLLAVVGALTVAAFAVVGWVRLSIARANRRRQRKYTRSVARWIGDR